MLALGEQSYLSAQTVSAEGISCGATRDCLDKAVAHSSVWWPGMDQTGRIGPDLPQAPGHPMGDSAHTMVTAPHLLCWAFSGADFPHYSGHSQSG